MDRPVSLLRCWIAAALLLVLAGMLPAAHGQAAGAAPRDSAVKAAFLYKFGSFVDWPPGAFQRPDDPLVIGVMADDAVADELEQLAAGRTVEGRPLKIRTFREQELPAGIHILFIGNLRPARLRDLVAALPGAVLVVTQQEGALRAGSVINFTQEGARVRFAVSLTAAEARGLRLSARLLAVAQSVEGKPR
jgi:hypothetical protein